jgi:hypothetical protein
LQLGFIPVYYLFIIKEYIYDDNNNNNTKDVRRRDNIKVEIKNIGVMV